MEFIIRYIASNEARSYPNTRVIIAQSEAQAVNTLMHGDEHVNQIITINGEQTENY